MSNRTRVTEIVFRGGLNLETPILELQPGEATLLHNYEVNSLGRYARIQGYERFDGRPSPSQTLTYGYKFDSGSKAFLVGQTVVGGTSGATGVVCGVQTESGDITQGNLVGYVVLFDTVGEFLPNENLTVSGIKCAVCKSPAMKGYGRTPDIALDYWVVGRERKRKRIGKVPGSGSVLGVVMYKGVVYAFRNDATGTQAHMYQSSTSGWQKVTTPTLAPNGRYEFRIANFSGSADSLELVGVDGKNKLFRFDGTNFTQITTGLSDDTPEHLEISPSQILFISKGSSLLYSKASDPTKWVAPDGGEIAVSDRIVGIDVQAGGAMGVFGRNKSYILYGRTDLTWELTEISSTTGAIEHSIRTIGDSIYLDDRGLTRLNRVQSFGNFDMATISQKIGPHLANFVNRVVDSFVIKTKNQYRLCFNDGTGVIVTFSGSQVSGFTTFDYNRPVRCSYSGEDTTGKEIVFFGSDDGYIYQAEKGTSFDGEPYASSLRPAFYGFGSTENKKRFVKAVVEIVTPSFCDMTAVPDFDYSDPNVPPHEPINFRATGGGGYFDQALWDDVNWSASYIFTTDLYISGRARNLSVLFVSESDRQPPHTLNSLLVHWIPKSRRR